VRQSQMGTLLRKAVTPGPEDAQVPTMQGSLGTALLSQQAIHLDCLITLHHTPSPRGS
jgi:hypothetical protein